MIEYTAPSADPAENIRTAQQLVRTLAEQDEALRQAYRRGWAECGEALARVATSEYERGWDEGHAVAYYRANREADERWTEVARQARFLGNPLSKTYAEKHAEEAERLKPRTNDFRGVEQDPQCLDRCRASVESITHARRRRAAA